ncbi:nucleotide-diphospho-sugar transferase [Catalinimonas sp. 4WD22]|uniref:nucleotide-diphospho-sugar transferase n=1 Tax=Catalinimonas locisalis TaxID=3133978 RepID=UPI003100C24D
MPFHTPILFIIFNRPKPTQQVFNAIKQAKPTKLYVAADGPRENKHEEALCNETRAVIQQIDWDCKVKTLFRDKNIGCGLGPKTAIDWLFEHEEEGIILEDDCLPSLSFFRFCEELLERYRHDTRIMHIGGSNFQYGYVRDPDYSYYFSYYSHEWGWASWRRAWKLYDFKISSYPEIKRKGYLDNYFSNYLEKIYRLSKTDKTLNLKDDKVNWWDYQWDYTKFINSGLSIVPNKNLVTNLGFGEDATHTKSGKDIRGKNLAKEIKFPLKHPTFVIRDNVSDKRYFIRFILRVILMRKLLGALRIPGFSIKG